MTNKKLKLAAMSVALTACVAAQPMAAHAVEGPDSVEDNAAPQAEPVAESSTPAPVAEEGEKQEKVGEQEEFTPPRVNEEAKSEEQAPAFGPGTKTDDITIDYKPAAKPEEPGKSGEDGEADGSEGSGETDETENPDGTYVKGDVIDNSKKDEATGKDGKIGEATKEETPDSSSSTTVVDPDAEVKKGDPVVGKDEDGNTTITTPTETTGTETTTTTGTGKADSSTTITDTKKGEEINLDDELGKDVRPDWKTDKDAKLGGYTVDKVEPAKDGNSKTLTLKKTSEPETKEMSAEDVAKLLDVPEDGVEKKTDDEGNTTYTLKKEETSTDENGNTVTRVTYYEITGNSVKTRTETTLVLKVEKGTVDVDDKDLTTKVELPSITAKNTDETKTDVIEISSEKLGEMLKDEYYNNDTGEYVYTETDANGKEYTYKVKKTEDTKQLTNKQLADRLGEGFTGDDNGVYYKGEKLNLDQMEAVRKTLSYTVEVTEVTKTPGQVSGKDEAETAAKTEAIKDALRNAAQQNHIELTEDDLKDIDLAGGTLTVTREQDGQTITYTFQYKGAEITSSQTVSKPSDTTVNGKDAEDVKETTVTGTAYVTNGTISWSKKGESGTYTASGTIQPGEHAAKRPDIPEGAVESTNANGDKVYTVTTKNPDGSTTETIYTFKNEAVTLTDAEKEAAAWKALAEAEHKSVEELQKEGYKINSSTFNEITKTTWTVETKTSKTETTKETLNQTLVDDTWTLEGTTLKTKDGQIYKNLKQNADGTYTATKEENGKTVTYTFTLGEDKSLDDDTIKAMLAKEFPESNGQITLDTTTNTATYKKADGSTVTIDYSNLSKKTLKIDKSVSDAVSVTETIKTDADLKEAQEKLYQELKKKVESIQLKDGEELWIGDLKITDIGTQKEEIIKHFTTAVSHENMSKEALIKALNAQADEAKTTKVTVNQGTKYEETLNNYYSGESLTHNPKEPPTYWNGKPKDLEQRDDITHLDLASGAKMDKLPDKNGNVTQTDCVLLAKNQKLEWNYDADKLVKGDGNTTVGLKKHISKDTEDGKGYHYEYDRLDGKNNNPEKSAFYKLTGTVAYDALKNDDGTITEFSGWFAEEEAVNAYLKAVGRTNESYQTLNKKQREEILGTYVVPITSPGTFVDYTSYQVYTKTAEMTSYGYMTRDANTCVNSTYKRQNGTWGYVGGYDLMISDLVQVSEGKVVGQTQSSIKTLWAPLAVRSTQSLENKSLQLDAKHTSTPVTTTQNLGSGYEEEGSFTYNVSYQHTDNYTSSESQGVQGTGTGKYKTFTQLVKKMFSGKGETSYDEGKVSYTHRTTEKVDTTPVSKETVTTTDAHVEYDYTTIETRTVTVNGEETVIVPPVDPDTPDDPVEDETPDEVVMTPETPELPPVQDTTPDAPVLPSDAVLPAVQDALPQTGVNWMAALGMAFSGMLLTIAGAFASLKYKEKH
jgi:hypothetical protein